MKSIATLLLLYLLPSVSLGGQFVPSCRQAILDTDLSDVARNAQQTVEQAQQIPWQDLEFGKVQQIDRTTIGESRYRIYKTLSSQKKGKARLAKGLLTFFVLEEDCVITHAHYIHHQ